MSYIELQKRVSHKYVDEYDYLDDWDSLGKVRTIARSEPEYDDREENIEDAYSVKEFVRVELYDDASEDDIRQALNDVYTHVGCAHEYDCCGCRSYWATSTHIKDDLWLVSIASSRNF